jgi:hypothetical protein
MTLADDIISGRMPDFNRYLRQGESLDDVDEYGFTPLIESAIANQPEIAQALLEKSVRVNKADMTGRTALHWAADNNNPEFCKLLIDHGADVNAFNRGGQSVLVFPLLRDQWALKQLLYKSGADLNFAMDFINTKLLGHRFQLKGDVDIYNARGEFIELDYEGFILEFTLDVIRDSLQRYTANYAARRFRRYFEVIYEVIDGFEAAARLLNFQHHQKDLVKYQKDIHTSLASNLLVIPIAYAGHAICFIRCGSFWAKIDRGENSLREGSVNIYRVTNTRQLNDEFFMQLLYNKQTERYIHHHINKVLGLNPILQLPISSQIAGNCSWANVEAVLASAYVLYSIASNHEVDIQQTVGDAMMIYSYWNEWDKDRALDECIQSYYLANAQRKASKASILGSILFQTCVFGETNSMLRAEKILDVINVPEHAYILDSYLEIYCSRRLTPLGNNLLKILEDNGIDPKIGVNPIATGIDKKKRKKRG